MNKQQVVARLQTPNDFFQHVWGDDYYWLCQEVTDACHLKAEAIAQNIANVNNPNYRPVHVHFRDQLKAIGEDYERDMNGEGGLSVDPIHFNFDKEFDADAATGDAEADFKPVVTRDPAGTKIDLNKEMADMYKNNQIYFYASIVGLRMDWANIVITSLTK